MDAKEYTKKKIRTLLESDIDAGLKRKDIAKKIGVSYPSTWNYLNEISYPDTDTLVKIAKAYNINVADLTSQWTPLDKPFLSRDTSIEPDNNIPVISLVKGGSDGFYDDFGYPVGHGFTSISRPVDVSDENAYGVEVRGDSMVPKFDEKDIVVVSPSKNVVSGDYVVAKLSDDQVMVKRIRFTNGMIVLESLNPAHDPIFKKKEEVLFYHRVVWVKCG